MSKYIVSVFDRAGEFDRYECDDFGAAVIRFAWARGAYPGKVVTVFNYDRCDADFDGLTADERDVIDAVV